MGNPTAITTKLVHLLDEFTDSLRNFVATKNKGNAFTLKNKFADSIAEVKKQVNSTQFPLKNIKAVLALIESMISDAGKLTSPEGKSVEETFPELLEIRKTISDLNKIHEISVALKAESTFSVEHIFKTIVDAYLKIQELKTDSPDVDTLQLEEVLFGKADTDTVKQWPGLYFFALDDLLNDNGSDVLRELAAHCNRELQPITSVGAPTPISAEPKAEQLMEATKPAVGKQRAKPKQEVNADFAAIRNNLAEKLVFMNKTPAGEVEVAKPELQAQTKGKSSEEFKARAGKLQAMFNTPNAVGSTLEKVKISDDHGSSSNAPVEQTIIVAAVKPAVEVTKPAEGPQTPDSASSASPVVNVPVTPEAESLENQKTKIDAKNLDYVLKHYFKAPESIDKFAFELSEETKEAKEDDTTVSFSSDQAKNIVRDLDVFRMTLEELKNNPANFAIGAMFADRLKNLKALVKKLEGAVEQPKQEQPKEVVTVAAEKTKTPKTEGGLMRNVSRMLSRRPDKKAQPQAEVSPTDETPKTGASEDKAALPEHPAQPATTAHP